MKKIIVIVLLFVSFNLKTAEVDLSNSIKEVVPDVFYTAKLPEYPNATFVFERLSVKNQKKWKGFIKKELEPFEKGANWYNRELPSGFIEEKKEKHTIPKAFNSEGAIFFNEAMNHSDNLLKNNNEIWITYITAEKDILYSPKSKPKKILMYVAVITSKDALISTHMGVSRSFYSFDKEAPQYSRMSMPLHSFAAQALLFRDPNKVYMMTFPSFGMEKIFIKSMSKSSNGEPAIFIGEKRDTDLILKRKDKEREDILRFESVKKEIRSCCNPLELEDETEDETEDEINECRKYNPSLTMQEFKEYYFKKKGSDIQKPKGYCALKSIYSYKFPLYISAMLSLVDKEEDFFPLLEEHPSALEIHYSTCQPKEIKIYKPSKNPKDLLFSVSSTKPENYQWIFSPPFSSRSFNTHDILVDLNALADLHFANKKKGILDTAKEEIQWESPSVGTLKNTIRVKRNIERWYKDVGEVSQEGGYDEYFIERDAKDFLMELSDY